MGLALSMRYSSGAIKFRVLGSPIIDTILCGLGKRYLFKISIFTFHYQEPCQMSIWSNRFLFIAFVILSLITWVEEAIFIRKNKSWLVLPTQPGDQLWDMNSHARTIRTIYFYSQEQERKRDPIGMYQGLACTPVGMSSALRYHFQILPLRPHSVLVRAKKNEKNEW